MNITVNQLFKSNSYLGENRRNWNSNMNLFIIGYKYDVYIFNIKYTIFLFKKVFNILLKNSNLQMWFIISSKLKEVLGIVKNNKNYYNEHISNIEVHDTWYFGMLSNYKHFKELMNIKSPEILFFFPNLSRNFKYLNILKETRKRFLISLGFINTSDNPYAIDYFIPINNNSIELLKFYFRLIIAYIHTLNSDFALKFFKKLIESNNKKRYNKVR